MKVKEFVDKNLEMFYKLDKAGVKNIAAALDASTIVDDYNKQSHIKNIAERKKVVAIRAKVSVSTVEKYVCLMGKVM